MLGRSWRRLGTISGTLVVLVCGAVTGGAAPPAAAFPAATAAPYVPPPAIQIYRFHVYSTLKSRWRSTVMIEGHVSTSRSGVVVGDRGVLERKLETGDSVWAPLAKVVVKRVLPKGRIEVQIEAEEAEAKVRRGGKLPFLPGQKVRLQIDRIMNDGT
jgi:hypothetical protein